MSHQYGYGMAFKENHKAQGIAQRMALKEIHHVAKAVRVPAG